VLEVFQVFGFDAANVDELNEKLKKFNIEIQEFVGKE